MTGTGDIDPVEVSNPKLLDLAPTWREYRGWTVLHRPVGASTETGRLYDIAEEAPANRAFYTALSDAFGSVLASGALGGHVVALPLSTFHVTVCDGLSPLHLGKISGRALRQVSASLATLPGGVDDLDTLTLGHPGPLRALLDAAAVPLRYSLASVTARGTAVLAELTVAPESQGAFSAICGRRDEFLAMLGRAVSADIASPWRPHVTLAYAANRSVSRAVAPVVADLAAGIVETLTDQVLELSGAAVYAFDDMVTFWSGPVGHP